MYFLKILLIYLYSDATSRVFVNVFTLCHYIQLIPQNHSIYHVFASLYVNVKQGLDEVGNAKTKKSDSCFQKTYPSRERFQDSIFSDSGLAFERDLRLSRSILCVSESMKSTPRGFKRLHCSGKGNYQVLFVIIQLGRI